MGGAQPIQAVMDHRTEGISFNPGSGETRVIAVKRRSVRKVRAQDAAVLVVNLLLVTSPTFLFPAIADCKLLVVAWVPAFVDTPATNAAAKSYAQNVWNALAVADHAVGHLAEMLRADRQADPKVLVRCSEYVDRALRGRVAAANLTDFWRGHSRTTQWRTELNPGVIADTRCQLGYDLWTILFWTIK
jgi:hypothetical protein